MKLNKKVVVLAGLLCLVPILFGLIFWNDLPDLMPTHFGMNGKTDGWSSKPFTVFGLPVIIMALHFLCVYGTMADPKKANISDRIMKLIVWLCPAISILCSGMMYAFALGYELKIVFWTMLLTGVVFIVVGNYLPKSRQNFTVGINRKPFKVAVNLNTPTQIRKCVNCRFFKFGMVKSTAVTHIK